MARAFSISRVRVWVFFVLSIASACSHLRLGHNTGLGSDFHFDLGLVAGRDTGGFSVGVAEAEQLAATHDGHPALP